MNMMQNNLPQTLTNAAPRQKTLEIKNSRMSDIQPVIATSLLQESKILFRTEFNPNKLLDFEVPVKRIDYISSFSPAKYQWITRQEAE